MDEKQTELRKSILNGLREVCGEISEFYMENEDWRIKYDVNFWDGSYGGYNKDRLHISGYGKHGNFKSVNRYVSMNDRSVKDIVAEGVEKIEELKVIFMKEKEVKLELDRNTNMMREYLKTEYYANEVEKLPRLCDGGVWKLTYNNFDMLLEGDDIAKIEIKSEVKISADLIDKLIGLFRLKVKEIKDNK